LKCDRFSLSGYARVLGKNRQRINAEKIRELKQMRKKAAFVHRKIRLSSGIPTKILLNSPDDKVS